MRVDMHIHTTASDGCWSPAELVEELKAAGIGLFSVTDHDSIGSNDDLMKIVSDSGLNYIPGVELTCKWNQHICHILGYNIDFHAQSIIDICKDNSERMDFLNVEEAKMLIDQGMEFELDDFINYSFDRKRGGGKMTNYLVDRGFFKTFEESLAHVAKNVDWTIPNYLGPKEIISIIKGAGGTPILAHPGSGLLSERLSEEKLDELVEMGIEGLECFTNYHSAEMIEYFQNYCTKKDLLMTAGSDCHGPLLKARVLGMPEAHLEDLNLSGIWPKN